MDRDLAGGFDCAALESERSWGPLTAGDGIDEEPEEDESEEYDEETKESVEVDSSPLEDSTFPLSPSSSSSFLSFSLLLPSALPSSPSTQISTIFLAPSESVCMGTSPLLPSAWPSLPPCHRG